MPQKIQTPTEIKKEEQKAPVQAPKATLVESNVKSITLRKGLKLPTEPYGGDKYGSIEVSLEVTAEVKSGLAHETIASANDLLDKEIEIIVNAEIEQMKGGK